MCHTPSLININLRHLEVIFSSSHHTFSHCDLIGSIVFGGLIPSSVWSEAAIFCCSVDQRWLWSTLGHLTSIFCKNYDFRRSYSWALKSRNFGFFYQSPSFLRWLWVDQCWLVMCCLWGLWVWHMEDWLTHPVDCRNATISHILSGQKEL